MAQVWLVTGSSRGLGRAIVEAGLAAGNKVLATARDIESLHDLSERHGDQIKLFALDVTDESAATSSVKAAIGVFGSLEVVINNAGYGNLSEWTQGTACLVSRCFSGFVSETLSYCTASIEWSFTSYVNLQLVLDEPRTAHAAAFLVFCRNRFSVTPCPKTLYAAESYNSLGFSGRRRSGHRR